MAPPCEGAAAGEDTQDTQLCGLVAAACVAVLGLGGEVDYCGCCWAWSGLHACVACCSHKTAELVLWGPAHPPSSSCAHPALLPPSLPQLNGYEFEGMFKGKISKKEYRGSRNMFLEHGCMHILNAYNLFGIVEIK